MGGVFVVCSRYIGEVGDLIVGRVTEVQSRRWSVEVSGLASVCRLSRSNVLADSPHSYQSLSLHVFCCGHGFDHAHGWLTLVVVNGVRVR